MQALVLSVSCVLKRLSSGTESEWGTVHTHLIMDPLRTDHNHGRSRNAGWYHSRQHTSNYENRNLAEKCVHVCGNCLSFLKEIDHHYPSLIWTVCNGERKDKVKCVLKQVVQRICPSQTDPSLITRPSSGNFNRRIYTLALILRYQSHPKVQMRTSNKSFTHTYNTHIL